MNSSCADSHCHGQMRHLPRGIDQMPLTTSSAILPHEKVLIISAKQRLLDLHCNADAGKGAKVVTKGFVPVVKQHHDTHEDMPNRRHDHVRSQTEGHTPMKGAHLSAVGPV